jgi:hypothetical protein
VRATGTKKAKAFNFRMFFSFGFPHRRKPKGQREAAQFTFI